MRAGEAAGSAIARSVDLAQHTEQLGYKRYWLAEHHSISGLACSATPVLIGHVAAATKTIRVGSGGVMLPNHAPLVVAEQFGTLEALYPGRIDLGLGRAPGGDFHTMRACAGFAAGRRGFSGTAAGAADLSRPGEAGQSLKQFPDKGAMCRSRCWGRAASARNWRGCWDCHLHSRRISLLSICTPRRNSIVSNSGPALCCKVLSNGGGAGDCGRDRCRRRAAVHDTPAAISAI